MHNPAQTFIAPPLGGWEGTNQHGEQTEDVELAEHLLAADRDRFPFNDDQRMLVICSVDQSDSLQIWSVSEA